MPFKEEDIFKTLAWLDEDGDFAATAQLTRTEFTGDNPGVDYDGIFNIFTSGGRAVDFCCYSVDSLEDHLRTLDNLADVLGEYRAAVYRELSKVKADEMRDGG